MSATDHHVKGQLFIPPEDVLRDKAGTAGTGSAAAASAAAAEEGVNNRRRPFIMVGGAVCCPVDEHVSACHEVVMLLNLSRRSSQSNDHVFQVRFAIACCVRLFIFFAFVFYFFMLFLFRFYLLTGVLFRVPSPSCSSSSPRAAMYRPLAPRDCST